MIAHRRSLPAFALFALLLACDKNSQSATDAGGIEDAGTTDAAIVFGVPGAESTDEACSNGIDDDGSGYTDCDDFWCRDTPTVQVCNSLENTDALCSNGIDDEESPLGKAYFDGLIDCADPDCAKNPRVTVCPPLRWELGAECSNGLDDDGDGLIDCDDPDCLHAGTSACELGAKKRVLFDDAHRERAGSADWVVDISGRHPFPSVPATETDWAGALSSMGKGLLDTGRFVVETLPAYGKLTFGESGEQDLRHYSVLVIPEPSAPLSESEAKAVVDFVLAGGGLLMVADHLESDRDGNGWDSVQVFNDMLTRASTGGLEANPFGFSVALIGYQASGEIDRINGEKAKVVDSSAIGHPVLEGPHGSVKQVGMHKGGLFTLYRSQARVLLHAMPLGTAGYETGSPYVVASEPGLGRVVALGDSSILNDGTDSHGRTDSRSNAWAEPTEQNGALLLNAVEWLAQ